MATREEWIGHMGQEWARRADALDMLLGPAGAAGLQALGPVGSKRILDLGCGSGATVAALTEAVGPDGRVTGIDVSPHLAAVARERLAGVPNAEVIEADAERHPFEQAAFDALFSRFGAMFFDNPPAAYANIHRALVPGAPVVIVAWREVSRNLWASVPMMFVAEEMPGARPIGSPGPGPFAWADPRVFVPVLEGAGFRNVRHRPYEFQAELSEGDDMDPLERGVSFMLRVGPLASRLVDADEQAKAAARAFLKKRLARHVHEGALRLLASAWVIEARA